jgi:hypothetical protein
MFIDQAKATGGANRPPPNVPFARPVSKKNTMMSFGSMPSVRLAYDSLNFNLMASMVCEPTSALWLL